MFSTPPVITETGMTLLLRAAAGEQITFTHFQAGKGTLSEGETPKTMTALKSVVIESIPITQATSEAEGYIQLTGSFDNQVDVEEDFRWTELGLIAEDEDGVEYLYAYGYDDEYAELINAGSGAVILEQYINCIIAIGDSENITAYVIPNATYASKQEFDAHVGNKSNPHEVTYDQTGAAAEQHTHSAADIISGILPVSRGGTGVATLAELKELIGSEYVVGTFTGDSKNRHNITLGFKPDFVILFRLRIGNVSPSNYIWGFGPGNNIYHNGCPASAATCSADELFARGHGGAAVTNTGFAVGRYTPSEGSSNTDYINVSGSTYAFIAGKIGSY